MADLTDAQKERLSRLEKQIRHDHISVSFTIDDRNEAGRRSVVFCSTTVSKDDGSWTSEEAEIVGCVVAKQIVKSTYRDALRRKVLPISVVREELPSILAAYDRDVARLMGAADGGAL